MRYTVVNSPEEFAAIIDRHERESEYVVLDIETTGLNDFEDILVEVQISGFNADEVFIGGAVCAGVLRRLSRCRVVGHNLRFDVRFLFRKGIDVTHWRYHDTLLLGHLVDENRESYSLDSYVKELWNDNYKEEFWSKYKNYQDAPKEAAWEYGARDIYYTGALYRHLLGCVGRDQIPNALVEHAHRLQYALLETEIEGVQVDINYLTSLGVRLKSQIEELKPKMRALVADYVELIELELWEKELGKRKTDRGRAGVERPNFSFDSPKQLQSLLYGGLNLPVQYNEKTKAVSVDDGSLESLRQHHPIIPLLQDYRGANKVYGAYVEGTLERMRNGRIYPEFRVSGTLTGRISHANPNLGQLPKSGGIRGIYVPDDGKVLISADYSQLEVCIEANLTGDEALRKIFVDGLSKHDVTAQGLGVSRDDAKRLNFCLQYWGSHFKVAHLLGISEEEGKRIWFNYWKVYKGPKKLKAETDRKVDQGIPLVNLFGRRRRFEARKRHVWDKDYRMAYNFLIQSTGADCTSRAFYLVSEWLKSKRYGRGLFTIHDELLIEVREDFAQEAEKGLLDCMVAVGDEIGLKIPLKAESSGKMKRWDD